MLECGGFLCLKAGNERGWGGRGEEKGKNVTEYEDEDYGK